MTLCWTAKRHVDRQGLGERTVGRAVQRGRREEAADEADSVEEDAEKDGVAKDAVDENANAGLRRI
jgi:hypothetical protein